MKTMPVASSESATHASSISAPPARLISLDAFRGLLVIGMVLVTNAGDWNHVYWPLKHADWNGSTPTDMIFPSFLCIVGVSMSFSFAARLSRGETRASLAKHLVLRSLYLIVLGLFLNAFPLFDLHNLRIPGVLQRIGLCCLLAGGVYLAALGRAKARTSVLVAAMAILLAGYWALMRFVPVPGYGVGRLDMVGNLGAYIDRGLFGTNHLWFWGGQMWDPEGMLSTLPATANALLGLLAGEWLRSDVSGRRKAVGLALAGGALMVAGLLLNPVLPINKKIWTDSFMLFSGGFSLTALAVFYAWIDLRGWRKGTLPALIFGSNAILGFALANMINPIFGLLGTHDGTGRLTPVSGVVAGWFTKVLNPWNASLAYAVCFTLLVMAMLWPLYRRRIFIRL